MTAISATQQYSSQLTLLPYADLLAYDKGWVWAIYYSNSGGQVASHLALIHGEGNLLIKELVNEILSIDSHSKNIFNKLNILNPSEITSSLSENLESTKRKYFNYLENELGQIQFEGLPTDKEAGSVKVNLENIFVPLNLVQIGHETKNDDFFSDNVEGQEIGEILSRQTRLAILAKPGGGKSTLIKRIAIAYAFPERRKAVNDKLP